jgi:hypothetical protein
LLIGAVWLVQQRRRFRAAFFLPACFASIIGGSWFGPHSTGMLLGILLFVCFAVVAGLTEMFWSPYGDDLAEQEYFSRYRE